MNHERAKRLLPAYADRLIGPRRRFSLSRHVGRCPSCLVELEAIQAMRMALRTNLPVHRAPPVTSSLRRNRQVARHWTAPVIQGASVINRVIRNSGSVM